MCDLLQSNLSTHFFSEKVIEIDTIINAQLYQEVTEMLLFKSLKSGLHHSKINPRAYKGGLPPLPPPPLRYV